MLSSKMNCRPCRVQTLSLLHVRWLVASRSSPASLAFILLSGVLIVVVVSVLQYAADVVLAMEVPHAVAKELGNIPRCTPGLHHPCFSLLWAPDAPQTRTLARAALAQRGDAHIREGEDASPVPGACTWPFPPEERGWVNASAFADLGTAAVCAAVPCPSPRTAPPGSCIPCAAAMDNRSISSLPPNSTQLVFWHLGAYSEEEGEDGPTKADAYAILWNASAAAHPLNYVSPAAAAFRAFAEAFLGGEGGGGGASTSPCATFRAPHHGPTVSMPSPPPALHGCG